MVCSVGISTSISALSRKISSFLTPVSRKQFLLISCSVTGAIDVSVANVSSATWLSGKERSAWVITFPLMAGDVPKLGIDGSALTGKGAAGNIVEVQRAQTPETQRVSTSASSAVSGGFVLVYNGASTSQLHYNASALEVRRESETATATSLALLWRCSEDFLFSMSMCLHNLPNDQLYASVLSCC